MNTIPGHTIVPQWSCLGRGHCSPFWNSPGHSGTGGHPRPYNNIALTVDYVVKSLHEISMLWLHKFLTLLKSDITLKSRMEWYHTRSRTVTDRQTYWLTDRQNSEKDRPQTVNDRVQLCVVHSMSLSWDDDVTWRQFPVFPATNDRHAKSTSSSIRGCWLQVAAMHCGCYKPEMTTMAICLLCHKRAELDKCWVWKQSACWWQKNNMRNTPWN